MKQGMTLEARHNKQASDLDNMRSPGIQSGAGAML